MKSAYWMSMLLLICHHAAASHILMITLGGTRSHKVPFIALGQGLVSRGHNVTLLSAFPSGTNNPPPGPHVVEITPPTLVEAVEGFSHMDPLGKKLKGQSAYSVLDVFNFAYKICDAFFTSTETQQLLSTKVDLLILDGAFPECLIGLSVHFHCPFVFLNTVAFHTIQFSLSGNPVLPSVTPFLDSPYSDRMDLWERTINGVYHIAGQAISVILNKVFVEPVVRRHLGTNIPPNSLVGRNVSLILQNGHHTITYPRPFLPGVVETACIHCTAPQPLSQELEEFVRGGASKGFIYVSFGTSLRSAQVPPQLRQLIVNVLGTLQHQVLWKYENNNETLELPPNVRISNWFPQQDLLGHPMIVGFVNHGGLHGLMEAVYHEVPMVLLPIFCDHSANSRKAKDDGYAEILEWQNLTEEVLRSTIIKVVTDKRYKERVRHRSVLLKDQPESPLLRALYWVEYVLRHKGAPHLQSPAKDLSVTQYYMLDSLAVLGVLIYCGVKLTQATATIFTRKPAKFKLN
ncbi:UDP-glucosyltransferase 2-like [Macrosteles quadrilineatus]|uniref:UDP-glucosyltransferase 2-like n=1 Tax=Macrosteles quadrilineatus TaxID=74068 RepID=UPI0023E269B2|nr:UDP-glucosyltransferase 2-like [Macrosteles quadrilineatus]